MRILPVLDLKAGQVVRGIGGRRAEYRPISEHEDTLPKAAQSKVSPFSSDPSDVARAFNHHFGFNEFYVADLDAIGGQPPDLLTYAALQDLGFGLMLDAGVRDERTTSPLAEAGIARIVLGLETLTGPEALAELCDRFGQGRIVFSLDLKEGRPLGDLSRWRHPDPRSIAAQAIENGIRCLIILDLARVGTGTGLGTEGLCRILRSDYRNVELVVGGGIRTIADLQRLRDEDVNVVLVASALHDGRIRPEDLAAGGRLVSYFEAHGQTAR